MSGGSAGAARFAFALQPKLLAGGDACRDLDGDLALALDAAGAPAARARFGDDAARSAALRAGARDREEALLIADLALAAAVRADGRRRSRRRARAVAR